MVHCSPSIFSRDDAGRGLVFVCLLDLRCDKPSARGTRSVSITPDLAADFSLGFLNLVLNFLDGLEVLDGLYSELCKDNQTRYLSVA